MLLGIVDGIFPVAVDVVVLFVGNTLIGFGGETGIDRVFLVGGSLTICFRDEYLRVLVLDDRAGGRGTMVWEVTFGVRRSTLQTGFGLRESDDGRVETQLRDGTIVLSCYCHNLAISAAGCEN